MRSILFIFLLYLTGCATGKDYHPKEKIWNLGFSDTRISTETWEVFYRGYDIPQGQARDYALLRAAYLCSEHGYPWLIITSQGNFLPAQGAVVTIGGTLLGANVTYPEFSMVVQGVKSKIPNALNTAFLISNLTQKYRISEKKLRRER